MAALLALAVAGCRTPPEPEGPAVDLLRLRPVARVAETRRFDLFRRRSSNRLEGWWRRAERNRALEVDFIWAVARDASVWFDVLDVRELQFLVKLAAPPGTPDQKITVRVNDEPVTELAASPIFLEYRFLVPARLLRHGRNTLTFRHAELSQGPGKDRRTLAGAYASILAGPACLPLRPRGEPQATGVKTERRPDGSRALRIVAPAEISYRLRVPASGRLLLGLELPPKAAAAVVVTATVGDEGETTEMVRERIAPSLFGFPVSRHLSVDLGIFAERKIVLTVGSYPEACKAVVGDLTLDRLALRTRPVAAD